MKESLRITRLGPVALLLFASACTMPASEPPAPAAKPASAPAPQTAEAPAGRCDAAAAERFVGQPYTDALGEDARQASGANTLRRIEPGQAVTLDFREDRLNIELDANSTVTRVRCG